MSSGSSDPFATWRRATGRTGVRGDYSDGHPQPHKKIAKQYAKSHRPLTHAAHRADVLRLQLLIAQGGIYLDLDMIVLAPFTALLEHEFLQIDIDNDAVVHWLQATHTVAAVDPQAQ